MDSNRRDNSFFATGMAFKIFSTAWVILGLLAFIYSLYCFGKSGSAVDKILGLVLSIFFGPLYFLYVYFYKSYCK